eukprot:gene2148-1416_t
MRTTMVIEDELEGDTLVDTLGEKLCETIQWLLD